MALYPKATQLLIAPGANDPRIEAVGAVLHVDAGNASTLSRLFRNDGGIESHFFVKKDGTVEQYRDTDYEADAQSLGNSWGSPRKGLVSIETQGYGPGLWTPAQLRAIQDLLLWLHATHGILLAPCSGPYTAGVGYHSQFSEWNPDNHSCPGPDRINQYHQVLVPWLASVSKPKVLPATPTHVSVGKAQLLAGLAELDKTIKPRRRVHLLAAAIRGLVNRLPER